MKPFDDMQPEEQDPQFEELITILRHSNLNPLLVDPIERAQVLSQARARLFPTDPEASQPEHIPVPAMRELAPLPSKPALLPNNQHRSRRRLHLLNVLAAVFVVALLVVTSFLIFGPWSPLQRDHLGTTPPIGPAIGPVGAPVKVRDSTFDGFERIFKITPGPYFLGELLEVDLSITNHTHTTYWLSSGEVSVCGLLQVATTGGGSPHTTDVQRNWNVLPTLLQCNWPWPTFPIPTMVFQLAANQTATIKQYVQLTSSGHIILTASDDFRRTTNEHGLTSPTTSATTFQQLFVSSLVPSDRQLPVREQGTQTVIADQPAVRGHLIGEWKAVCTDGFAISGPMSITAPVVVTMPDCVSRGTKRLWRAFVVGAPGYALISGKVN